MNYLLDTCVVSELLKPVPNSNVLAWLRGMSDEKLFLSVITIGEIRKGLTKLATSRKREMLASWFDTLIKDYYEKIYIIDLEVAENWGMLQGNAERNGKPMPSLDGLIAAIAYTHSLTLVTRNVDDFINVDISILNPWHAE